MSSFLATPATYYSYGQQSDYSTSANLNQNAGQTAVSNYHTFQDLSSSSSPPTTNSTTNPHYYSMNDNQANTLSNTPPSGQSMNSSTNGPSNSSSNGSLDQMIQQAHQQMNGSAQQLSNTSGTPSNQYQTTAQLTPPPSVSTEGSHQSPVLAYPSYRDYTELSNSNNSINSTPTTSSATASAANNNSSNSQQSNSNQSNTNSTNQSPSHNSNSTTNNMTNAGGLNPLLYADSNNSNNMDLDHSSGMSPSTTTYTPSIHNPYHLAHQSNTASQFNLHHSQSTNHVFGPNGQPAPNSNHLNHPQFANSQDGLINQHIHQSSYQLHHAHLNSHNQIQVQTPQHSAHPHLHPQLNALNVAVHVHQFNSNPSNQTNSYLPDNHLTTSAVTAVSNAFTNSGSGFINGGLLTPAQPFNNCQTANGLPPSKSNLSSANAINSSSTLANGNNPNSRNDSPLGPYQNLTNASAAIGQSIVCDSAAASASLLLDAHNHNNANNGSGSNTPNPATTNGFHSLMYHLNPLSSNSPSPTLQQQQSATAQLHLAQHHHHHLQNQFVQPPPHLANHPQLHPHQQQQLQQQSAAQQLIAHPASLNHHLNQTAAAVQPGQFAQHNYTQLNSASNHLNQHPNSMNSMHQMHFKMQTATSNPQMTTFNSPSGIVNNQSGNGNPRNSPNAVGSNSSNKQVYKWMQVKRSQPKTGMFNQFWQ